MRQLLQQYVFVCKDNMHVSFGTHILITCFCILYQQHFVIKLTFESHLTILIPRNPFNLFVFFMVHSLYVPVVDYRMI